MKDGEHLINLHLMAEALQHRGICCTLRSGGAMGGLRGMKFFEPGMPRQEEFLLICPDPQSENLPTRGNLLLLGNWENITFSENTGCLVIPEPPEMAVLFNLLTDLFVFYETIEEKLRAKARV